MATDEKEGVRELHTDFGRATPSINHRTAKSNTTLIAFWRWRVNTSRQCECLHGRPTHDLDGCVGRVASYACAMIRLGGLAATTYLGFEIIRKNDFNDI